MPKSKTDIPSTIKRSDEHAQDIYREAHDSAVGTYGEGEHAHRVAYAALKHSYRKQGDHWVKKEIRGPSDEQAKRGYDPDRPPAKTAGGHLANEGKSKRELYNEARRLHIPGRSSMDKEALEEAVMAAKK